MTDIDACDWGIEPDFRRVCGQPAVQWIVHMDGGNLNVHCPLHYCTMDANTLDAGWIPLTREEAAVMDVMQS